MRNFLQTLVSNRLMKLKRLDIFLLVISLILCFSAFETKAQKKSAKKISVKKKVINRSKIISSGCINGKAVNLVKPNFPKSAEFVNVKGAVSIQVLIDEAGNVINAKATKGHPLLIPASLKAAQKSTFIPTFISNNPVRVSGIIVYNFFSDKMNWLEIGFNLDEGNKLHDALPPDFVEEKLMLIQAENLTNDERKQILFSVENLIKSKIADNEKKTWLFTLGRNLKEVSMKHWNAEQKKLLLEQIDAQLFHVPNNVSPILVKKLDGLKDNNFENFNNNLLNLIEKLYAFGN